MMTESRLQRWSRKKTAAGNEAALPPPAGMESGPSPEEQELALNETLPEREVLEKYALPDPDAIELGTDITGFMAKEIPDLLRHKALRALWKSNPVLAVLDGLNDYDEDFTDAATAVNGVKTLYKVGQGLIDKTAHVEEPVEDQGEAQAGAPEAIAPVPGAENPEPENPAESLSTAQPVEPVVTGTGPAPRYRPRMRFD